MRLGSILVVALAVLLLAAAAHVYGLQPGGQCVSQIYSLTYQGLQPGWYRYYGLNFAEAGTVRLIIRADVSSNIPVKLAIFNAQGQEIWATQPSTRIVGTYTVDLEAPGAYGLAIENPSSNTASASFTAVLNVTMCGGPAPGSWLGQYIKLTTTNVVLNGGKASMAPMGIASYGVMEVGGQYFTYTLTTDAVRGVVNIPSDISASSYREDGSYYGQAFSVQLNAFVVARLKDGAIQHYWIQNVVLFDGRIGVGNNIWNATTTPSILDKSAVSGNGAVYVGSAGHGDYYAYGMPGSIPFGRVTLEMGAYAAGGEIIVEFYANGQKYDVVTIRPYAPATSAYIAIAPATTPTGIPLDLELVFAGHDGNIPYAVLKGGQIGLELYARMNGEWVPPPSALSIGYATYERSYAYVEPQGVGSAIVKPGPPNPRQLWAGTVVVTPFGINITTSTDLSPYAESLPELVDFGNGVRLVSAGVYINGRPAQLSSLSNVPLGSLVEFRYKRQYLVSISVLDNHTTGWFDEGSTIVINGPSVIDFGNGTRLAKPTLNGAPLPATYRVTGPADLSVSYVKQYLVTYSGPTWLNRTWINAGTSTIFRPPQIIDFGNGTRLAYPLVNGMKPPLTIVVNRPLTVTVSYIKQYLVILTSPVNRTAIWANASSAVVLSLPPVVDLGNDTRLVEPRINGTRPPLVVEVNRPMSFVGTYTKQYLVTYSGPTWLNRTWINAGASAVFNPPRVIDLGNGTRLAYPLINKTAPPFVIAIDKPSVIIVGYTRQYLISLTSPINNTVVWINASSPIVLNLPPLVDFGNDTRLVEPRINGTRPPLTIVVDKPMSFVGTYTRQYLISLTSPINNTVVWINASSPIVLNLPPLVDFGNDTRLVEPRINGTRPPLAVEVDRPMSFVGTYTKQYLVTYSGPTWRNQTWINASALLVFSPPQIIDFGNDTRLAYPLVNGARPPLAVVVDRPLAVAVSYTRQYLVSLNSPINRTAVWANASSAVVLSLPPVVDFGNDTRLVEPRINGTRPPLAVEVDRPMSFVGTYVNKQYLVTYSGPTWLNRTWIDAGTSITFNPPRVIDFGNNTRLINPLVNGTWPLLSISVDKPLSLSVEYARQYLVSVSTPFNKTGVWINAGASYAPPASATSRNGVTFVPAYLTIDGRRAPLAPVAVESPLDITVHYNAYAEVPTKFAGLPALYAEASITCGGASNSTSGLFASSLRLELIDAPAGTCSASPRKVVPSLVLVVVVAVIAAIAVLFRKLHKRSQKFCYIAIIIFLFFIST